MFSRSIALAVLTALSAVAAWPIFFYENNNCNHYPVFTLDGPPEPNVCYEFGHVDIKGYHGGTGDAIQKLILYSNGILCHHDAAHHSHGNYTITNGTNHCVPFVNDQIPRSYVFIEEILEHKPAVASAHCENPLSIQD